MLVFNGKKYAKNKREFVDSLFHCGGTCVGYYQKTKGGYRLYNMHKEVFAFLSDWGGFHSCIKNDAGRYVYFQGASNKAEKYAGLADMGFMDKRESVLSATKV